MASWAGCAANRSTDTSNYSRDDRIIGVWLCPPTGDWMRADGTELYPPSWPTAAIVCDYGHHKQQTTDSNRWWSDTTLFLVAGRDFDPGHAIRGLQAHARLATPCRSADLRGHWITLDPHELPFFVLVYNSGGTAGLAVEVYRHWILYADHHDDQGFQDHQFQCVFRGESRILPYAGDLDGDGKCELYIAAEVTNLSGADDTPQVYRCITWQDAQLVVADEIPANELMQHKERLTAL
jgi:hypothetical protein